MEFKDCVKFAKENPVAWLATAEGDQPRIRGLSIWFVDETGIYFQIHAKKDIYKQLRKNPKVEAAFHKATEPGAVMRVAGKVEFLNDPAFKEKVLKDRPFLAQMGLNAQHPDLILFRIARGQAYFWTFETNLAPKKMIQFG
ncbi:MAG: pyridoxamine 5'-phosphate oxidase [Desulfobacteraceae bacterium]|nr:MAG: pyridoxamine 5'-phosphate oxidase [Desulfobacteraceae bacterium]